MNIYSETDEPHTVSRLTFFPRPYPGESFYSVLCRYHARSANVSFRYTMAQLFGYETSIQSTLLSSFHLEYVSRWVPASSGITPISMFADNTAYPIYALEAREKERRMLIDAVNSIPAPSIVICRMYKETVSDAGFLRYCPHCVEEQRRLYGEPYWQLLPQMRGAEYCPVHGCQFLDSQVPVNKIHRAFFPASSALRTVTTSIVDSTKLKKYSSVTEDYLISISKDMHWILRNRPRLLYYENICFTFAGLLNAKGIEWPLNMLEDFHNLLPARITDDVHKRIDNYLQPYLYGSLFFPKRFSPLINIILMNALSDSVENFCRILKAPLYFD